MCRTESRQCEPGGSAVHPGEGNRGRSLRKAAAPDDAAPSACPQERTRPRPARRLRRRPSTISIYNAYYGK